jgi:hypothetical protein
MAQYKLRSPDQPVWLRAVLWLFEFSASLKLAVVLIFASAAVLGLATFVEKFYGTAGVQFGMYGAWWFTGLNALLAWNIFAAAAIRYPWKRHQTGFVITHIGLLTLLFGCLMSRRGGIDAQMPVFEGARAHLAFEDSQHFLLSVRDRSPGQSLDQALDGKAKSTPIPFVAGPFNWSDYETKLPFLPWRLAHRDQGVLYDRDGVKLEVLDYYSNSAEVQAPYLRLWLTMPGRAAMGPDGKPMETAERWMPIELHVRQLSDQRFKQYRYGTGAREEVGGGKIIFSLSGSQEEVDAFLHSQPEGEIGKQGQAVLYAAGKKYPVDVAEKAGQGKFPLGESGYEAEIIKFVGTADLDRDAPPDELHVIQSAGREDAENPVVELRIHPAQGESQRMLLFADMPELNLQDYEHGVFGAYWFDHGKKTAAELQAGGGSSRIDILQGPLAEDGKARLYYRYWNRKTVVAARELPLDETPVDAFKMPIAQLRMYADRTHFVPSDHPEKKLTPKKFDKTTQIVAAHRGAKLRMTVDGQSETFWLEGKPVEAEPGPPVVHTMASDKRVVSVSMPLDAIDVGFQVELNEFEMKLDPGTSQPSHYSSYIDVLSPKGDKTLAENVWITMNAPVDFADPAEDRSYRLYQESFMGPWRASDPEFKRLVPGSSKKKLLYGSVLTVNYDPGRGVKYIGCLLVIGGIATMFYMRAYFFKPAGKAKALAAAASPKPNPQPPRQPVTS